MKKTMVNGHFRILEFPLIWGFQKIYGSSQKNYGKPQTILNPRLVLPRFQVVIIPNGVETPRAGLQGLGYGKSTMCKFTFAVTHGFPKRYVYKPATVFGA